MHIRKPALVFAGALLVVAGCAGNGTPIGGGLPVIEVITPVWSSAGSQFKLRARVVTASGAEPISDDIDVSVAVRAAVAEGGTGPIVVLNAGRASDPKIFEADATELTPQSRQQFEFWWAAEKTTSANEILELAKSDPSSVQVDCPDGPTSDLVDSNTAITALFPGPMTEAQIDSRGYTLNNHGYPAVAGIGVSFVRVPPLDTLDLSTPALLFFDGPAQADLTDLSKDEPYRLVGWAYGALMLTADQPRPQLGCIPHHEWFIHEAGWHTPNDGGMYLDPPPPWNPLLPPPAEAVALGANPTNYHPRIWDLHLWVEPGSAVPKLSRFNRDSQGNLVPASGVPAPAGMFFHP